jgi:hypothetical protein
MVHVAQFLTSLTLNPSSDGDDFCKGVSSEISLHLLARSDLVMVSELGAREHGAMHALKRRSSDQKFGKPNPSS